MAEQLVGEVTHYYGEIDVAGIEVSSHLQVGDTVHFVGHTTDFTQEVTSIEIDHESVESATTGDSIGIKVGERVREGDAVYKV